MFLGLRTVVYPAADLAARKAWFTGLLGATPYFDEPFYVGFSPGGFELGLDPAATETTTYWGVEDAETALRSLVDAGASEHGPVREVGGGILVAAVAMPGDGATLGIIENPHFRLL